MKELLSPAELGRELLLKVMLEPAGAPEPVRAMDASRPVIRLIAIDLDGTLLDDSKQIHDHTVEALKRVSASGVKVVIASARPPRSVRHIYQRLGLDTLSINYNGALVWDEPNKTVVQHFPMEGRRVRQMIEHARGRFAEVLVSCEVLDRWFTDRFEQTYTTETGRLFRPDVIAPLDTFLDQPITKLLLLGHPDMIGDLTLDLRERFEPGATVVRCDPELVQIMDRKAGKASALLLVAQHYGVPMGQVMAIGDAANDLEMLDLAGVSVAMDNAHDRVKEAADWVAPSNNDHGVHAALRFFGLCE